MKRGRVSFLTALVCAALVGLGGIVAFSSRSDSPEAGMIRFMDALARGDAKALAQSSRMEGDSEADLEKKWEETCKYAKHYLFRWEPKSTKTMDEASAVGKVSVDGIGGSGPMDYNVPLVKHEGKWKVDLSVLDRAFFPLLPK